MAPPPGEFLSAEGIWGVAMFDQLVWGAPPPWQKSVGTVPNPPVLIKECRVPSAGAVDREFDDIP
eukprot:3293875-Karenia_brevis.AAC.1